MTYCVIIDKLEGYTNINYTWTKQNNHYLSINANVCDKTWGKNHRWLFEYTIDSKYITSNNRIVVVADVVIVVVDVVIVVVYIKHEQGLMLLELVTESLSGSL